MKKIKKNKEIKIQDTKFLVVLMAELLYILVLLVQCFGGCASYRVDKEYLHPSFDGGLIYFDDGSVGMEAEGQEPYDLMSALLGLESGAYQVTVTYDSISNYENVSTDNSAGNIYFSTENGAILRSSTLALSDGNQEAQSRFWIRKIPGGGQNLVRLNVRYNGNGRLAIKNILIEEKREYRVITCFAVFLLFLFLDALYVLFFGKKKICEKDKFVIVGILSIVLFSSAIYFTDFLYGASAHDMRFHLARIVSLAEGLREGQMPNRIAFHMVNGHGYANPLFYGELFLLLPAILYNFYVPLQTCYQIFAVFVNLLTCVISYWCFKKMTNDWKKGLFGAAIYTLSSYRLTNLFLRSAVGEYTAMIFLPLLLYGFFHLYTKEKGEKICLKDYLPIILAATGIINSHVLSCEMVCIFSVLFALFHFRKTFSGNVFVALVKSIVFSVLLNLWFLVPFFQAMQMDVGMVNTEIGKIESGKVYPVQLFGIFHTVNGGNVSGTQYEMPLSLGAPIVFGCILFVLLLIMKNAWELSGDSEMRVTFNYFAFGMIAVFFTSSLCRWDNLIYVDETLAEWAGMVQFPWRYLGIASVCLTFMTVMIMKILERHVSSFVYYGIMAFTIFVLILTESHFIMEYVNVQEESRFYSRADLGTMDIGYSNDYLLQGTNLQWCKQKTLWLEEGISNTQFRYDRNGRYLLTCTNEKDESLCVDVPVVAYENYHAYQEDGSELMIETGSNNRVRIHVPGHYEGEILLKYKEPVSWRMCEVISCLTGGAILFVLFAHRKKERSKA